MEIRKIATIYNAYTDRFGIPRQSGIAADVTSRIVFEKPYRTMDAVRGLAAFSHLWLIWEFSELKGGEAWRPVVRPPKLGGNARVGVWATRSPYRPNPLGLSCVRLCTVEETAEGPVLTVTGADLLSGTPIYDIKPYIPYADRIEDAVGGFADDHAADRLQVVLTEGARADAAVLSKDSEWTARLCDILAADPRPAYQQDPDREYGMRYDDCEVSFTVDGGVLTVLSMRTADGADN